MIWYLCDSTVREEMSSFFAISFAKTLGEHAQDLALAGRQEGDALAKVRRPALGSSNTARASAGTDEGSARARRESPARVPRARQLQDIPAAPARSAPA